MAMSAGSRARPGKPACESRCRVLAWARRGAWGQPGLEGRRREVCHLGPVALPSPGCPTFGGPVRQAGLSLSRGPSQPPNTLHDRLRSPQARSRWLLQALPALRGLTQLLCLKLMRPQGHPAALEEESRLCHHSSLSNPLLTSSTSHQVLRDNVGRRCLASGPHPIRHQVSPSLGVVGFAEPRGHPRPLP